MKLNEYLLLIDKFKIKYGLKIKKIREEYEKSIKMMSVEKIKKITDEYREIIIRMIIELSEIFLSDYSGKVLVALTGSLARKSNTIFSDIDISFLTSNSINNNIIEIEEKIAYILQQVMKYRGRDKIHTMTVYLPLINNTNFDCIYENKYPLKFKDGTIYYSCRKNAEKLMYESYNATRSIYDVVQYFNQNDTAEKLYEWTNCFEILYNKGFENEYFELRHISKTKINLLLHIDKLIEQINNDNFLWYKGNIKNCLLKEIYKSNVLFNVYNLLAIDYRYEEKLTYFNLEEIEEKSMIISKSFFEKLYEYLNLLQILQLILNYMDCDLSSHFENIIDLNTINQHYEKLTGQKDIIQNLNNSKVKIYNSCIFELKKIRRSLNE